jgi:hypothetical protein
LYGAPLPTLTATFSGLVNGDTAGDISGLSLSTTATAASNVGDYPITASGATSNNYTISFAPGTLGVTPAPLNIIADNKARDPETANPLLTAQYIGLVNGDRPSNVPGLMLTTTATTDSPVGTYPIELSGATDSNYSITFTDGTLLVLNDFAQSLRNQWQTDTALAPNFASAFGTAPSLATNQTNPPQVGAQQITIEPGGNISYRDHRAGSNAGSPMISTISEQMMQDAIIHVSSFDQPAAANQGTSNHAP